MIRISKDCSQDFTMFTGTGDVTVEEMVEAVVTFYTSEPTKLALWNFLEARGLSFSPDDIDRVISIISKYCDQRKGGRSAIVASSDYVYGMARMYKAKSEVRKIHIEYHVTRSVEEASRWLGVTKK